MYSPANPEIVDTYFKLVSGILPTRARLHHLNSAWWGISADTAHVFTTCQMVVPVWAWMGNVINQLTVSLVRTVDIDLLTLEYPATVMKVVASYLVMMTIKHWWDHLRQYRILTVKKLNAIVKQDQRNCQKIKLPNLSKKLYDLILT